MFFDVKFRIICLISKDLFDGDFDLELFDALLLVHVSRMCFVVLLLCFG